MKANDNETIESKFLALDDMQLPDYESFERQIILQKLKDQIQHLNKNQELFQTYCEDTRSSQMQLEQCKFEVRKNL